MKKEKIKIKTNALRLLFAISSNQTNKVCSCFFAKKCEDDNRKSYNENVVYKVALSDLVACFFFSNNLAKQKQISLSGEVYSPFKYYLWSLGKLSASGVRFTQLFVLSLPKKAMHGRKKDRFLFVLTCTFVLTWTLCGFDPGTAPTALQ